MNEWTNEWIGEWICMHCINYTGMIDEELEIKLEVATDLADLIWHLQFSTFRYSWQVYFNKAV